MSKGKGESRPSGSEVSGAKNVNGFTPTETRILRVLADGNRHHKDELFQCLEDDLASKNALEVRICMIRKKLEPKAETILVEWWQRRRYYRQVRLIWPESRG